MERLVYTIILHKSLAVSNLQVAILARSSREMSQTVRIDWKHFLSRVRVSVRPSNFFIRENTQKLSRRQCLLNVAVTVDRSPATTLAITAIIAVKDRAKTARTRIYIFTAWKMWFRNYYLCVCIVWMKNVFFNAFLFENSYYFISG